MTSIIAGKYQGSKMEVPKKGTRPTTQRVKEAIFSTLDHYGVFEECSNAEKPSNGTQKSVFSVLDLYAGSGALGIETMSRGYNNCVFVDVSNMSSKCVKNNLNKTVNRASSADKNVEICQLSVTTFLKRENDKAFPSKYDLIFLDPPYDLDDSIISENINDCSVLLEEHSVIVLERSIRKCSLKLNEDLEIFDTRKYGESIIYYIQLK